MPIERLIFIMETDYTTVMMLLKSGELDLDLYGGFSETQYDEIMSRAGLDVKLAWPEVVLAWMNTKRPPTDDEHFRKALQYAFDYDAIFEEFGPFVDEAQVCPSMLPVCIPIEPQPRQQNLERAHQELELSKYADNLDDVKVVFHFCNGLDFEEDIGLQLQADMAQLGVTVEVAGPPWPEYSAECSAPETTPNMTIFSFCSQGYPAYDYYTYMMFHPNCLGWIFGAHWYFEDSQIIQLLDATRAEADPVARLALYEILQPVIGAHALALYVYEKPLRLASQDHLVGPRHVYTMVGPEANMANWRIGLMGQQTANCVGGAGKIIGHVSHAAGTKNVVKSVVKSVATVWMPA